jgi:hypothetical protein
VDAAEIAGLGGEGAGFEEAGGPEPFVDAHMGIGDRVWGLGSRVWGIGFGAMG